MVEDVVAEPVKLINESYIVDIAEKLNVLFLRSQLGDVVSFSA